MLLYFLYPIFFILFGIMAWRRLEWGIYTVILFLPAYLIRFQVFVVPLTLLEGLVIVLFLVWLLRVYGKKRPESVWPREINKFILPIGLFLLAATIGMFIAPQLRAAAGIWKAYFIEPILFLFVFVNVINTKEKLRNVLWALGISLVMPGIFAVYQKITGNLIPLEFWTAAETRRVTSVYGYPNAIGLYFAPIVAMFIAWSISFVQEKKYRNFFLAGAIVVLGSLGIVFAVSKGAVLAVAVGLLFYSVFWPGLRRWFAGLLVLGLALMVLVAPHLLSTEGQKTVAGGGSLEIRTDQWQEALQMLSSRPFFGAGLSGFQAAIAPYHQKDYIEIFMYPHQIVLNFWTETGLLGLLAFIWLAVLFYKQGFRSMKQANKESESYALLAMGGMTALLAHGLVDAPYFKNDLAMLFWIIMGIMLIIAYRKEFIIKNS